MVKFLYPMDGISPVITMEKSILSITTANKLRGLTPETGWLYYIYTHNFFLYFLAWFLRFNTHKFNEIPDIRPVNI